MSVKKASTTTTKSMDRRALATLAELGHWVTGLPPLIKAICRGGSCMFSIASPKIPLGAARRWVTNSSPSKDRSNAPQKSEAY